MSMMPTSVSLLQRIGLWALVQALPDEPTVRRYLRTAYIGLSGVIIGSVLIGSSLAAALVAIYRILSDGGMDPATALLITTLASVLLIGFCFWLAARRFASLSQIKGELSVGDGLGLGVVGAAVNSLAEGFLEGLVLAGNRPPAATAAAETAPAAAGTDADAAAEAAFAINPNAERDAEDYSQPQYKPHIHGEHGHA